MTKVPNASDDAIMKAFFPISRSLDIGNSIPTTKSTNMTPISANRFSTSVLVIRLKGGVYGPIIIPAMMKPMTIGCLSLYEIKAMTAAIIIITVKSCTTVPISITIILELYKKEPDVL
jgi:hypothetical protein